MRARLLTLSSTCAHQNLIFFERDSIGFFMLPLKMGEQFDGLREGLVTCRQSVQPFINGHASSGGRNPPPGGWRPQFCPLGLG